MTFDELAVSTLSRLKGAPATLAEVFTEPMLVDAKYTHTKILMAQLQRHGQGWAKQQFALGSPYTK